MHFIFAAERKRRSLCATVVLQISLTLPLQTVKFRGWNQSLSIDSEYFSGKMNTLVSKLEPALESGVLKYLG